MPSGQEFITHELDEAIAFQQSIVDAEKKLGGSHPDDEAKQLIGKLRRDDEKLLERLTKVGKPLGASGKREEVVEGMASLMEQTAEKAGEELSEAYEAQAVLVTLKRKQQDSGSALVKIGQRTDNDDLKELGDEVHKASRASAEELAKNLAGLAVKIATA
jgi:transcriptional regulator of heat shock response